VLQDESARAVQQAGIATGDRRGVPARLHTVAGCFQTDEADAVVVEEGVEDADGVRAAADAGADDVRQRAGELKDLRASLLADDLLQVPDHGGERMRPGRGAEDVVRG